MKSLVLGATLVATILAGCGPQAPAATPAQVVSSATEAREVRTARAEPGRWPLSVRTTGETAAFEESTLSAKVAGRIGELAVDVGSRVARGDVVARTESRDYELRIAPAEAALAAARALLGLDESTTGDHVDPETTPVVRAAQAELDDARRERDRVASLADSGVSSKSLLERAEARYATAEAGIVDARQTVANRRALVAQRRADLALARQALEDTQIVAPFAGAVAERLAGTGDYLTPGDPIARLVRFDPLRVRFEVPERDAVLVRVGQETHVESAGLVTPAAALVARISPALDPRSRTLLVELELANPDLTLRPGAFAAADIVVDPDRQALTIPAEAVITFAGIDKVLAVREGVAQEVRIVIGRRDASRVEVLSGLEPGGEVVLSPGNLRGGAAVRVAR